MAMIKTVIYTPNAPIEYVPDPSEKTGLVIRFKRRLKKRRPLPLSVENRDPKNLTTR